MGSIFRFPPLGDDDKDLIYEGIATYALIFVYSHFAVRDDKDLIYEGIATNPNACHFARLL